MHSSDSMAAFGTFRREHVRPVSVIGPSELRHSVELAIGIYWPFMPLGRGSRRGRQQCIGGGV